LTARLVRSAALGDVATNLAWTGSSGDRVQVESSTGDQWRSVVDRSGTSGSTIVRRAPGSVAYRARPVGAGGPGPWLQLDGVTTARVDAGSRSLTVTGSWAAAGLAGYSGGTAFSTKQVGATATWHGRISDLLLIGPVGPTRGRFDLIVDGKLVQTVTEHARTFVARTVLAQLHWSTTGDHTITIRTRSSSGGSTVAIDDLVTLATGSLSQPGS
jgi:hypothetical protein